MRASRAAVAGRAASYSGIAVAIWIIYVAEAATTISDSVHGGYDSNSMEVPAFIEYDQCLGDCKDGIGVLFSKQGIYEGQFAAGKKDGVGVHYWPDGSWHAGEYRAGRRHGGGVYRSAAASQRCVT